MNKALLYGGLGLGALLVLPQVLGGASGGGSGFLGQFLPVSWTGGTGGSGSGSGTGGGGGPLTAQQRNNIEQQINTLQQQIAAKKSAASSQLTSCLKNAKNATEAYCKTVPGTSCPILFFDPCSTAGCDKANYPGFVQKCHDRYNAAIKALAPRQSQVSQLQAQLKG